MKGWALFLIAISPVFPFITIIITRKIKTNRMILNKIREAVTECIHHKLRINGKENLVSVCEKCHKKIHKED